MSEYGNCAKCGKSGSLWKQCEKCGSKFCRECASKHGDKCPNCGSTWLKNI